MDIGWSDRRLILNFELSRSNDFGMGNSAHVIWAGGTNDKHTSDRQNIMRSRSPGNNVIRLTRYLIRISLHPQLINNELDMWCRKSEIFRHAQNKIGSSLSLHGGISGGLSGGIIKLNFERMNAIIIEIKERRVFWNTQIRRTSNKRIDIMLDNFHTYETP